MKKKWVAFKAGGALKIALSLDNKSYFYPLLDSHTAANEFWHGRTDERTAWSIGQVFVFAESETKETEDLLTAQVEKLKEEKEADARLYSHSALLDANKIKELRKIEAWAKDAKPIITESSKLLLDLMTTKHDDGSPIFRGDDCLVVRTQVRCNKEVATRYDELTKGNQ